MHGMYGNDAWCKMRCDLESGDSAALSECYAVKN